MPDSGRAVPQCPFELVVVLASRGGLPAMSALVAGLPATFPSPVLVAQHRPSSANPDRLPWLLGRRAALPVRTARPGKTAFAPGVTIIPGGRAAVVNPAGRLRLAASREPAGDALLASAAEMASRGAVIAVVLSGMPCGGGAEGVRAVKRRGGRVLAQDPATAEAPGMPASAIATGCVDFVLPPDRLATALVALAMAPGGAGLPTVPPPHWAEMGA